MKLERKYAIEQELRIKLNHAKFIKTGKFFMRKYNKNH